MRQVDVCVVGGGPAGIGAALAAAEGGGSVLLVDERDRPGGQYFNAPPDTDAGRVRVLRDELAARGVEVLPRALAWGVFDGPAVLVAHDGRSEAVTATAVVIAAGGYDRPVPFPGWTLPGVMTAGAAQTLAKAMRVAPGRRVLLAGAGPFLLPVAQALLDVGAAVVLAEPAGRAPWLRLGAASLRQPARVAEAVGYGRRLWRRVERLPRHRLVRAVGTNAVEGAVVARVDAAWRALPGTERVLDVDAVAVGYGFLGGTELAEQAGCELRFDPAGEAWFVAVDESQETTVPGVYAAGELTGIGGNEVSYWEGRLAGAAAVGAAGLASEARRQLRGRQAFAARMTELFRPRAGLWEGLADDVTVCRCEEVTAGEIRERARGGCASVKAVKDWTRAGMGLCQGRICGTVVARLLAAETGRPLDAVARGSVRPPVKPVPIDVLAATELP